MRWNRVEKWTNAVLNHPWIVITIVLLITVLTGSFLPRLVFNASIDAMIPDDDPVLADLRQIADDFGSQEMFFIAIEGEDVFSPSTLRKIADLAEKLETLPGVEEVQSPFNAQIVESSYFGIEIRPMVALVPQTPEDIAQFKEDILASSYAERLITSDGRGAALLLDLSAVNTERSQLLSQIEKIVVGFKGPEEIHIVGDAYVLHYTEQAMKQDLLKLVPFVVLVIILVLYLMFRSVLGVFVPLATVGASLIWTMGIMSLLRIPVSMISMIIPVVLVTLGIASSIHILNKYQEGLAKGLGKREALQDTFRKITSPVVMAALTTAVGFGSLITAFVHPIREFGVLTALGVMIAMGLSLSLVPALLILAKEPKLRIVKVNKRKGLLTTLLNTFTKWAIVYSRRLAIVALLVLLVFIFGATRLTLESNIVNYFGESSPVKKGTRVIEDVFGGSMQISVVVDTGQEDGIKDPKVLAELIAIEDYLNSWETINHATSIADVVRELNQALWDGEPEFYALPDTREGVAQQLLLFTMQGGSGLDTLVSYDYSRALVTAQMKTLDAHTLSSVITQVEDYLSQQYDARSDLEVRLIGTPKVMMRLMNRYVQTQVSSLVSSTIAVGIIVALLMKSVALGLLSLIPLLFTVVLNFGIMGYAGLPLDAVTSVIASLAIGIGVDYAIHYISRYRQELADGQTVAKALEKTGISAGRSIFYNALALVMGFLVLVFSHFRAIGVFGFLISITMIVSSLAALLVIPLLLKVFSKDKKEEVTR
ncbi:MAG: MMPL family transporter [Firmicutes bacterium]|nr:MMPL family transporter [Bacillota bacterium]